MKLSLHLLASLLFITNSLAIDLNDIVIPDELKQYKCDSSEVRLSKNPLSCLGDFPKDFDIPAIKLNLEDLQRIFDGAVSSGGRVVGPMNTPRQVQPLGPEEFNMNCKVRILLDGGKRVSYLSTSQIELTNTSYFIPFAGLSFRHFLTPINDVDVNRFMVPAPKAPNVSMNDIFVEISYKKALKKYTLKACVQKNDAFQSKMEKTCSHTRFELSDSEVSTTLMSTLTAPQFHVERTIKLSCQLN